MRTQITTITDTWGEAWTPVSHAATLLGVSPATIRTYVERGRLTGKKLRDHWLYVRLDQVEQMAQERAGAPAIAEEVAS